MKTKTADHYKHLLFSNPNAAVGFTLAAQAVYAARNGEFNPNAEDHNDEEYRTIARELKRSYGENLTRDQVEAEMNTSPTTELRIRNVPNDVHAALKHMAVDERLSLNSLLLHVLYRAVRQTKT